MFKAKNIMTRRVICARPEMPIYDAIRLLAHRNITGLPVVDAELNLLGLLTEKDVLRLLHDTQDKSERVVSDYMSKEVVSFDVNSNLIDLCDCLVENTFRRVPITEDGKLMGIVSRSDLIHVILRIKHQVTKD